MLRITLLILSLLLLLQLILTGRLSVTVGYFYLLLSSLTFFVYWFDKSAARKGNWRIKERHLHLLSLFGGWWGALLAQQFLRHKSIKVPFLWCYGVTVCSNIGLLIYISPWI